MQEKLKETKGITLVALIITVIILLILAGVTISLLIGDNGMVTKTKQGVEVSEMASIREQADLVRNEQGINTFGENPQELTKSSYINALNVSFEGSIVEGSRVIVKDKKYAIFVKSNLDIQVLRNDGKELADGELRLDYDVSEDGLIEIYPRIGGIKSYKSYAEKILEGKSQEEKEQMFVDGFKIRQPEGFASVFGNIENPTFDDVVNNIVEKQNENETEEEKQARKEAAMVILTNQGTKTFDEVLIENQYVKPEGYNFDKYCNVKIKCPDGSEIISDTYSVTYQTYKNGEYTFSGEVVAGKVEEGKDEVTVVIEDIENKISLNLKINVTAVNNEIRLPVYMETDKDYKYDFEVDWGDGTDKQQIDNNNLSDASHIYNEEKEYTIKILGTYEGLHIEWDDSSMPEALVEIEQWGVTGLKEIYLANSINLNKIASPTTNSLVNMQDFNNSFSGCSSLKAIPQDLFSNCPNVTSFEGTFSGCSSLTGKSVEIWKQGRTGIDENNGGNGCYYECINLDDYNKIPSSWRNGNS